MKILNLHSPTTIISTEKNIIPLSTGGGTYQREGGESSFITHLRKVYDGVNKKLESGKITWQDITYSMYQQLSESNREKIPEPERERVAREFLGMGIGINTTIPPSFEQYAFIKDAQVMAWFSELRRNPSIYETIRFPVELKDREDIKNIRLEAWAEAIGKDERLLERAPTDIVNNPRIYEKVVDKVILNLTLNPLSYDNISLAMRRGQQRVIDAAQTLVIPAIVEKLKKNPTYYDKVPYEFIKDNRVIDAFKQGYLKVIETDPRYLNAFICKSAWAIDIIKEMKNSKEVKTILDTKKKPITTEPTKEETKSNNKLACSSCNVELKKISKAVNVNEEIYHCPNCDNIGTLNDM